jgi:hypothetical protein
MSQIYCDLIDTETTFNDRKVYKCSYCGITLALDTPKTSIICFKKMTDAKNEIRKIHNMEPISLEYTTPDNLENFIYDKIVQNSLSEETKQDLCSNEQIQTRLSICENCEHYKNDLCELCGCQIVREQNYMNKLANKSASCPVGKWLPIIT